MRVGSIHRLGCDASGDYGVEAVRFEPMGNMAPTLLD